MALALHLGASILRPPKAPPPAPPVTVTLSAAGHAAALESSRRALADARRRAPSPADQPKTAAKKAAEKAGEKKEPEPPAPRSGQVVELAPAPPGPPPPKDTTRLSEREASTEHETVSRHRALVAGNVMPERTTTRRGTARTDRPPSGRLQAEPAPQEGASPRKAPAPRAPVFEVPRQQARDRLALRRGTGPGGLRNAEAVPALRGNAERLRIDVGAAGEPGAGAQGGPRRTLTMQDLLPDVGVLARVAGAPAPDHVRDVPVGEGTFLNAQAYRYAGFFNRLKAQVASHWRAADELRRRDPTGNIYGGMDRGTLVWVDLDAEGALLNVTVQESSGLAFLDELACDAFRRAAPFLHPPRGLPDADGRVSFGFGFQLHTEAISAFGGHF